MDHGFRLTSLSDFVSFFFPITIYIIWPTKNPTEKIVKLSILEVSSLWEKKIYETLSFHNESEFEQ